MADRAGVVRAAGGVVFREGTDGPEVLLVHRAHYGDWTLPKGKLDPGETHEEAALREVEEETSLRCRLGPEVASTAYDDHLGRRKEVRYWMMFPVEGEARGQHEVDAVRWLPLAAARDLLSYDRDRAVLDAFATLPR